MYTFAHTCGQVHIAFSAVFAFSPNLSYSHSALAKVFMCVLAAQSCLILGDSMNCSPPGSTVHRIFQARILEWIAMPFSRESSPSRIKSRSAALQTDSLPSEPPGKPWSLHNDHCYYQGTYFSMFPFLKNVIFFHAFSIFSLSDKSLG